jgi:hypothetical protein
LATFAVFLLTAKDAKNAKSEKMYRELMLWHVEEIRIERHIQNRTTTPPTKNVLLIG